MMSQELSSGINRLVRSSYADSALSLAAMRAIIARVRRWLKRGLRSWH